MAGGDTGARGTRPAFGDRGRRYRLPLSLLALAAAASLGIAPGAPAQSTQMDEVRGRVWSDEGVPIRGAAVRIFPVADSAQLRVTGTDALGFFSFRDVRPGTYVVTMSVIGYQPYRSRVTVGAAEPTELEIRVPPDAIELAGVSVEAERSRTRARFEESAGATVQEISRGVMKALPGLVETDPIRVVELLPGVTTVSDFSAAFNVRGGSADQNLILLDGVPIYNPFHLGGIFSVFNADMVSRAELQAGGFSARHGGRVSSVLAVESDLGDGLTSFDGGISLLASRLAVGGALPRGLARRLGLANSRWRVSARRSYFDILLKPWTNFPYHLNDVQAVMEAWTRGANRIQVTAYTGRDVLRLSETEDNLLNFNWGWGNDAIGTSWTHPMRGGGMMDIGASFTRFAADFDFVDLGSRLATDVREASIRAGLERRPTTRTKWASGVAAKWLAFENSTRAGGTSFGSSAGDGWEGAAYSQIEWDPSSRWLLELGLRLDHWRPDPGEPSTTLSPRVAVKHFLGDRNTAIRVAGGRYSQFLHSLRDEEFPVGLDQWVLAGDRAPRVLSDQIQLGVERFLGGAQEWFLSLEGYYRTFDGVITVNSAEDPNDALDDLLAGEGYSYGVDAYLRRDIGLTTGWISASFLKTERTFPDPRSGVHPVPVLTYPPVFDRRLDVDLVLRRPLGWWGLEGGLRANFGTGLPYTRALGAYPVFRRRLVQDMVYDDGEPGVILGPRNGTRYPARHRLDISVRKPMVTGWGQLTPYLSVINVYNKKNVLFYFYDYQLNPPVRSGVSMIPLLPTLGVEVSF